jgi:hypothetical protein
MGHGWVLLDENHVKNCPNGSVKKTFVTNYCGVIVNTTKCKK